jgi:hypothetical protein
MKSIELFWQLSADLKEQVARSDDYKDYEGSLVKLLCVVKDNPLERKDFRDAFLSILDRQKQFPLLIVAFCMHELKWDDVRAHCRAIRERSAEPEVEPVNSVLEAFYDNWPVRELFEYYSSKKVFKPDSQIDVFVDKNNYFKVRVRLFFGHVKYCLKKIFSF